MKTVYLAGPIAGLNYEGATAWRDTAADALKLYCVTALTPMRDKHYLRAVGILGREGYNQHPLSTNKGLVTRDRHDCQHADAILMNLSGAKIASIGSMIEFGWADSARVPIVTVLDLADTDNPHIHGFVKELSGFIVPTLEQGIDIILSLINVRWK